MNPLQLLPDTLKEALRARAGAVSEKARLSNLRQAGFSPVIAIDGGAYRGDWTVMFHQIFTETKVLMFELQPTYRTRLEEICNRHTGVALSATALGSHPHSCDFVLDESNSRFLSEGYHASNTITVQVDTLWNQTQQYNQKDIHFIKLDLQGSELKALDGAGDLWGSCEVFLIESSWIPIGDAPPAIELIQAMHERGYRLYDVWGFNYRPLDNALWQTDFLFVRMDSPLLANENWE